MIASLFRRPRHVRAAATLYVALVEQSRRPEFYDRAGVPDSLEGRFDMVVLHAFLVLHRLKAEGKATEDFAQALFDHMFADMDLNLRELGVGDLSVGKRVKKMAQGFYGRAVAYEKALAADDDAALIAALRRNLYGAGEAPAAAPAAEQVAMVAGYLRREVANLAAQPAARLIRGEVEFGPPPAGPPVAPPAA